jgi:hypothetical protein
MADVDGEFLAGVFCGHLVGVVIDTSSALPNAERVAVSVISP